MKDKKKKQDEQIFNLWMQCYSTRDIAEAISISQPKVIERSKQFSETILVKSAKTTANFEDGYKQPLYNVWTKSSKTKKQELLGL